MKFTIEGFSQQYAMTLKKNVIRNGKSVSIKIDCTDLVILRWFVDFYPNMKKYQIDGKEYVWVAHKKLLEDLPLIDITQRSFADRMKKLVEFELLDYKYNETNSTSLYCFGKNYANLIGDSQALTVEQGGLQSTARGVAIDCKGGSNQLQGGLQSTAPNKSINNYSINNKSINNIYIVETQTKDVISYLNEKTGKKFTTAKCNAVHIQARLNDGYTVEDMKKVIDLKTQEWKGTQFDQYLRPKTLFRPSNFESYLNKRSETKNECRTNETNNDDFFDYDSFKE